MEFCTAINCMDGRVQIPVITYLKKRFEVDYVDVITEPGPNKILAEGRDEPVLASVQRRIVISVEKHNSKGIAVVGHHDCAGNPVDEPAQQQHTAAAVGKIRQQFGSLPVIGLWVNDKWEVTELTIE